MRNTSVIMEVRKCGAIGVFQIDQRSSRMFRVVSASAADNRSKRTHRGRGSVQKCSEIFSNVQKCSVSPCAPAIVKTNPMPPFAAG
jgi:hypothetical protein